MRDIESEEDIEMFVRSFYGKALNDDSLSPFFKNMDFENHVPKMIGFWSFVLLDKVGYKTDLTQLHLKMPIKKEHFDRWIELFNLTIDAHFIGEKATAAKERAFVMRWTMESKINNQNK